MEEGAGFEPTSLCFQDKHIKPLCHPSLKKQLIYPGPYKTLENYKPNGGKALNPIRAPETNTTKARLSGK